MILERKRVTSTHAMLNMTIMSHAGCCSRLLQSSSRGHRDK
jgi:hypothetical protein